MTITEFLLARIAEDEEIASAASQGQPQGPWLETSDDAGEAAVSVYGFPADRIIVTAEEFDDVRHIVRHDPARVLAECEAKRRLVEIVEQKRSRNSVTTSWIEALMLLAMPYADHPDYQPEWRP